MNSETREKILDLISNIRISGLSYASILTNYLYGLFDGYDYSHKDNFKDIMRNLQVDDINVYNEVKAIYEVIDTYDFSGVTEI